MQTNFYKKNKIKRLKIICDFIFNKDSLKLNYIFNDFFKTNLKNIAHIIKIKKMISRFLINCLWFKVIFFFVNLGSMSNNMYIATI